MLVNIRPGAAVPPNSQLSNILFISRVWIPLPETSTVINDLQWIGKIRGFSFIHNQVWIPHLPQTTGSTLIEDLELIWIDREDKGMLSYCWNPPSPKPLHSLKMLKKRWKRDSGKQVFDYPDSTLKWESLFRSPKQPRHHMFRKSFDTGISHPLTPGRKSSNYIMFSINWWLIARKLNYA